MRSSGTGCRRTRSTWRGCPALSKSRSWPGGWRGASEMVNWFARLAPEMCVLGLEYAPRRTFPTSLFPYIDAKVGPKISRSWRNDLSFEGNRQILGIDIGEETGRRSPRRALFEPSH